MPAQELLGSVGLRKAHGVKRIRGYSGDFSLHPQVTKGLPMRCGNCGRSRDGTRAACECVPAWVWLAPEVVAAVRERDAQAVIRFLRHLAEPLSQEALARMCGVAQSTINRAEAGRGLTDRRKAVEALRGLGAPLDREPQGPSLTTTDLMPDATGERSNGDQGREVEAVRAVLLDYRHSFPGFPTPARDEDAPQLVSLRREVDAAMAAYQASDYRQVLRLLPALLERTRAALTSCSGQKRRSAEALFALSAQACAMVLTKLGETELAWIAAERGLNAAMVCEDLAVQGALLRSSVHALHSCGQHQTALAMTADAATYLRHRGKSRSHDPRMLSVYGTLLLPGAVAAARSGDRATANDYLDEAQKSAERLARDANHMWTAFGPTNVALHRVTVAGSLDHPHTVLALGRGIDTARLPVERRVRHLFELAQALVAVNDVPGAADRMLEAEGLSASHVHRHMMSQQIVARMLRSEAGRRDRRVVALAHRMGTS
ncbi:helix-turn-helix transcriptional regulator [Nocardiopsis nanhaiensis]